MGAHRLLAAARALRGAGAAAVAAAVALAPSASSSGGGGRAVPGEDVFGGHPRAIVHDLVQGDGRLFASAFPSLDPIKARRKLNNMVLLAGTSVPALADEISYELATPLSRISVSRFADGEVGVQINDSVRGRDVFIIQSTSQPVNETTVELLLTIAALRRASAGTITAVVPYYGYLRDVGTGSTVTHQLRAEVMERQQRDDDRSSVSSGSSSNGGGGGPDVWLQPGLGPLALAAEPPPPLPQEDWGRLSAYPVSAADVAKMLETAGCDRVIAVETQPAGSSQIDGFFSLPVENLRTAPLCVEHLSKLRLSSPVIVAPNEATIQMASDVAAGLERRSGAPVGFAVTVESGPSRGTDRYVHRGPTALAPDESRLELVGSVAGCDVVLVDQMVDTAGTMMRRVKLLKDAGARRVVAFATHGLFNSGALAHITRSPISDMVVTNTVSLRDDVDVRHTHKLVQLSVAPLVAEAILRVQMELSLQALRTPSYASTKSSARYKGQE